MTVSNFHNLSGKNNCSENLFFALLYKPDWSMAFGILTSLINIAVVTPLSLSIIWYERFGSDLRRTLLNQFVSSMCWNIFLQNVINVPLEIILTLFGPLDDVFCSFHMILKYGSMLHIFTMLFFMTLVKYLSIFVFKNPTGIHSQFWCFFINFVSVVASLITQTVYVIVPGKNPLNYYVCTGRDPTFVQYEPSKKNYPMVLILFVVIVWYLFVFVKIKMFEKKVVQGPSIQTNAWTLPPVGQVVEKNTLANLGTIALTFSTFLPVSIVYWFLNNVSPNKLEVHPYFMLLHFFHHGVGFIWNLFLVLIFLSKSSLMRDAICREIKIKFQSTFIGQ